LISSSLAELLSKNSRILYSDWVLGLRDSGLKEVLVNRVVGMVVLVIGVAGIAFAGITVPEINAGSAASTLALVAGAVLVMRGRRRN
jgi:hypothetical protein